jgi:hypothetical protein
VRENYERKEALGGWSRAEGDAAGSGENPGVRNPIGRGDGRKRGGPTTNAGALAHESEVVSGSPTSKAQTRIARTKSIEAIAATSFGHLPIQLRSLIAVPLVPRLRCRCRRPAYLRTQPEGAHTPSDTSGTASGRNAPPVKRACPRGT